MPWLAGWQSAHGWRVAPGPIAAVQMTAAINKDMLKDVGDPAAAGASKVTCFTCHRGAIKPLNAPSGGGH